jgi:signal transduction histidine kinase
MRKPSNLHSAKHRADFESLIGLGVHSARKSYYPELLSKIRELEELNADLEHQVEVRTKSITRANEALNVEITEREQAELALNIAKQEAERANRSKDKYLAAASHDLLQPMNAARLLVTSLNERLTGSNNQDLANRIHQALLSAEELLQDLLDIAKLDADSVTPNLSDFPIASLFKTLEVEFQPLADEHDLQFRMVTSQLSINSDSHLLIRILRNFISNAVSYSKTGKILLGCRRRGQHMELQVLDTGIGIPTDKLKEVFKEFHQLKQPPMSNNTGVGLGLAIVDRIGHMLNHPIRVHSILGKGSCFTVTVPLAKTKPKNYLSSKLIVRSSSHYKFNNNRVLVVENDLNIISGMQHLLSDWGCIVSHASDIPEALLGLNDHPCPNIILADYHLDESDTGIDVINAVRCYSERQIPAILLTADHSEKVQKQCDEMAIPKLNKPIKPNKLRALLQYYLTPIPVEDI